jgi:hypothetical protein
MHDSETPADTASGGHEVVIDGSGSERRRAFRRKLPFGRGAVLLVGERAHIVGLADVSVTGAYLSTHAPVAVGETHLLKLLILPERVELALQAEVVRVAQAEHESPRHPRGVAVRFLELDPDSLARLSAFVAREPKRVRPVG